MKSPLRLLLLFCLLTHFISGYSQEKRFFMPKEIRQAYDHGTRSYDGKPGEKYWHNTADYQIEVEVFPAEKKLAGTESVTYYNNSPDNLTEIVIRLYHDNFRKANPRAFRVRESDITDGVEINKLTIAGTAIDPANSDLISKQGTNMTVQLPAPLPAGGKLDLEIGWKQRIPETTVRTGAYDSTSFFLAYWYPQIAVYDDIFGWDRLAYDFSTEFYNNLANFDVKITAPTNYTVLSTGVLNNAKEVLSDDHHALYQKSKTATETVTIVSPEDLAGKHQHQSGTWHYQASEVSDFAFCLSDHFCWDAASQKVDGRDVLISTFYPAEIREQAKEVTARQQKMMKHFSEDIPGIPYPYPEFTTFISSGSGGGGMEYPMMANNGGPGLGVTVHEMFHTYFPMYVRTNEKRFAWMDEGWADFTTSFLIRRFFQEDEWDPLFEEFGTQIQGNLGSISDLPLITSTQFMDFSNYGYASYSLPAFLYAVLENYLREEVFLDCWREYIRRWAKKSPTPYDFMYTFEQVSGQDLSWFWNPWFFNFGTVDLRINSVKDGKLVVENLGSRPVPLSAKIDYKDGSTKTFVAHAKTWEESDLFEFEITDPEKVTGIAINARVPDNNVLDNYYPSIKDQYGDLEIPDDILGSYPLNEFPASVFLTKKDGLLHLAIPAGNISDYLIPENELSFNSLSGSMQVEFEKKEGLYHSLSIQISGIKVTGQKK